MFWEEGVIIGVLEDLGEMSERDGTEEALWIEGVSAVTWELGRLGTGSEEAGASGRRGLADFLCFDLGEG